MGTQYIEKLGAIMALFVPQMGSAAAKNKQRVVLSAKQHYSDILSSIFVVCMTCEFAGRTYRPVCKRNISSITFFYFCSELFMTVRMSPVQRLDF